ncbi:hypothetical protein R3W88_029874 [Solanum pinnatisectum]|uniref:Uncharacterized protein n=1 Tax=Solanum pinnatisectum TaxID=50273 RepID=A0AAV9K8N6_9SOLN|nr:hypothetical protein R3W88_029874 [Solanum pinnatisectum]
MQFPDELLIRINHTTLCFVIKKNSIITRLNCFTDEDDSYSKQASRTELSGSTLRLKYQNIHPSLKNAFYQLPVENDVIPENASKKINRKSEGNYSIFNTNKKKKSMHVSWSFKEKTQSITHVLKTSKNTPFGLLTTPMKDINV